MKILVFNGSPKGDNSDTLHITKAFLDGIKETTPAEIKIIDVTNCNIKYCTGCFSCKRNGGTCIFNDDMKDILNEILSSDVLLFSTPLYVYGFPAPLKALLDRTMPLSTLEMKKNKDRYEHTAQADFSHLKYVLICGCGFPNSKHNFEAITLQFKMMFPNNHTIITVPESPMFNAPEAISVTAPFLEKVKNAGKEFAKNGKLKEETTKELSKPMIPEDVYADICNGKQ